MKANIYPGRGSWPDWNNLEILQRDQLPPHAYRIPFPDLASCRHALAQNRRYLSPYVIMLNDGWEYRLYSNILQVPENILSFRSGFEPADVPGSHPAARPDYGSCFPGQYGFPVVPPLVPQEQPVLVYRRTCRLPLFWGGLRKHLVLQGVSAAAHIFVNGRPAGYAQGTSLPAEIDVTSLLHDGDNELFVFVYPLCCGSYLESQADCPASGIIRDIYFEAVAPVYIHDLQIRTTSVAGQDEGVWQLDLKVMLVSCRISTESPSVRIQLCRGQEIISESSWSVQLSPADSRIFAAPVQTTGEIPVSFQTGGIEPWSDEKPVLYDLYVGIEERGSRELVYVHQLVGFRQITADRQQILLNGKPLLLKGAVWPASFQDIPQKTATRFFVRELRKIKRNGLNTLYLRHFPADPILLELCDIYGIYVIDEAPIEASNAEITGKLQDHYWKATALDRLERLMRRDINHPSVILWSAGVFRPDTRAVAYLVEKARAIDPGRPIHLVDTPDLCLDLDRWLSTDRSGSAATVNDVIGKSRLDWLSAPQAPGLGRCYGIWGNLPDQFLSDIQYILRPADIKAIDAASGVFLFTNRMNWTTADCFEVVWQLLRNGHLILSGELDSFRAEPGFEQYIEIWYGDQQFDDGADYIVRFDVRWAAGNLWGDAGSESFKLEFQLTQAEKAVIAPSSRSGGRLRLERDRHHLIVSGSRFWLVFNRVNGTLESWRIGDKEMIATARLDQGTPVTGLIPSIVRPAEFLDGSLPQAWSAAGYDRLIPIVISEQSDCDGQSAVIEMVTRLAAPSQQAILELLLRFEVSPAGDLSSFINLTPLSDDLPPLPCFSLVLGLKADYSQISWYGAGPQPSFTRFAESRHIGLFHSLPWPGGSEDGKASSGVFADVRWLNMKDKSGFGLAVHSDRPFGYFAGIGGEDEPVGGFSGFRQDLRPIWLKLYHQLPEMSTVKAIKSFWRMVPVVTDNRSADS